jgi:hypothetical protein
MDVYNENLLAKRIIDTLIAAGNEINDMGGKRC